MSDKAKEVQIVELEQEFPTQIYLTEYTKGGRKFSGPRIEATSWESAQEKAPVGHTVIGELVHEVGQDE
jgi:hypothetical protein